MWHWPFYIVAPARKSKKLVAGALVGRTCNANNSMANNIFDPVAYFTAQFNPFTDYFC